MNLRGAFCLVWCATLAVTGMAILPCSRGQEPPTKSDKPATTATSATTTSTTNAETGLSGMAAFQEGLKEFRAESFGEAAKNFQTAAETQTMEVQKSHAYAWLARTELHLHNIGAAQTAAEKAVDTARDSSNAQTAMAEVYFRQGKIAEARQILIPLVKSQSGGARTYFALSKIYRITGNYKSAHELVEVAHKLDPRDPDIDATWMWSLPRAERLAELKKRMEGAGAEDKDEKAGLANRIALMEDREKNPARTCKLVSKITKTETDLAQLFYDGRHLRGYGLNVKVNNTSATLLLDTGAGGILILISSKIAEKAGLTKVADAGIGGIGDEGQAKGYIAFAEKLKVGDLEFENCYVEVVDKKRTMREDGLVGANVFDNYLIDLDFPERKMRLSQLPGYPNELQAQPSLDSEEGSPSHLHNNWVPPQFADFEKVYRAGHMLLVPVGLNQAPAHQFLIDTGSFDNTVSPEAARQATKVSQDYDLKVKGLSGEVKNVFSTDNVLLTFGRYQRRGDLVGIDMSGISNSVGTEISGTLGFAMLQLLEIKIDYRDNLVQFKFDTGRIH